MARGEAVYEAYLDGCLVARGTKEECAERLGVAPDTVKRYACPSQSRPGRRIQVARLAREEAEREKPFAAREPVPSAGAGELLKAMRRRRDMLLGLDCNKEWEL